MGNISIWERIFAHPGKEVESRYKDPEIFNTRREEHLQVLEKYLRDIVYAQEKPPNDSTFYFIINKAVNLFDESLEELARRLNVDANRLHGWIDLKNSSSSYTPPSEDEKTAVYKTLEEMCRSDITNCKYRITLKRTEQSTSPHV